MYIYIYYYIFIHFIRFYPHSASLQPCETPAPSIAVNHAKATLCSRPLAVSHLEAFAQQLMLALKPRKTHGICSRKPWDIMGISWDIVGIRDIVGTASWYKWNGNG